MKSRPRAHAEHVRKGCHSGYIESVIHPSKRLDELEDRYQRVAFRGLSFEEALGVFASLWVEARELNPDLGADWLEDLEPDLAVARAVNGLRPGP